MSNQYKKKRHEVKPDISVLIPYFREPEKLRTCLKSIIDAAGHDRRYEIIVAVDEDDPLSVEAVEITEEIFDCRAITELRPDTLGTKLNMLAKEAKGDIITFLSQDYTMATEGWPDKFREAVKTLPNGIGVLYPHDDLHPDHAAFPLMTRRMMETLTYFVPAIFPFWFVDTWIDELGILIGVHREIDVEVKHQGERGKSHGLADLAFWVDVFDATRHLRVFDAVKLLRVAHNISENSEPPPKMIKELNNRANLCERRVEHLSHPKFIEAWEKNAQSEPSAAYPKVKENAQQIVEKIRRARPKSIRVGICIPSGETWRAGTATDVAGMTAYCAAHGVSVFLCNLQGSMISHSRNNIVDVCLGERCDYLMWIDSDMKFPADTIIRLLKHGVDIVGATYNKKVAPYETLGRLKGDMPAEPITGGLHEALLLPGGMMLVKADVYRKIEFPAYFESYKFPGKDGLEQLKTMLCNYFRDVPPKEVLDSLDGSLLGEWIKDKFKLGEFEEDFLYFSEDLAFCRKARRAGYKIWADLSLTHLVAHLGTNTVTCKLPGLDDMGNPVKQEEAAD